MNDIIYGYIEEKTVRDLLGNIKRIALGSNGKIYKVLSLNKNPEELLMWEKLCAIQHGMFVELKEVFGEDKQIENREGKQEYRFEQDKIITDIRAEIGKFKEEMRVKEEKKIEEETRIEEETKNTEKDKKYMLRNLKDHRITSGLGFLLCDRSKAGVFLGSKNVKMLLCDVKIHRGQLTLKYRIQIARRLGWDIYKDIMSYIKSHPECEVRIKALLGTISSDEFLTQDVIEKFLKIINYTKDNKLTLPSLKSQVSKKLNTAGIHSAFDIISSKSTDWFFVIGSTTINLILGKSYRRGSLNYGERLKVIQRLGWDVEADITNYIKPHPELQKKIQGMLGKESMHTVEIPTLLKIISLVAHNHHHQDYSKKFRERRKDKDGLIKGMKEELKKNKPSITNAYTLFVFGPRKFKEVFGAKKINGILGMVHEHIYHSHLEELSKELGRDVLTDIRKILAKVNIVDYDTLMKLNIKKIPALIDGKILGHLIGSRVKDKETKIKFAKLLGWEKNLSQKGPDEASV